jgi:chromosome segregation ATPase
MQRLSALDTNIRDNKINHVANRRMDVQQSDRRGSYGQSPLQSPGGSASEASTPIHPAPPVPNMVPNTVSATTPPFNTEGMTTLAAIRKVQLKKINSRTSQSTDLGPLTGQLKVTTDQLKDMKEQLKDTKEQLNNTKEMLDAEHTANLQLSERVKALERLPSQLEDFIARIDKDLATVNNIYENEHATVGKLVKGVDSLNGSMTDLQKDGLSQRLKDLQVQKDLQAQINNIDQRGNNTLNLARSLETSVSSIETEQTRFYDQQSKLRDAQDDLHDRIVDVEKDQDSLESSQKQQAYEQKQQLTRSKILQTRVDGLDLSFKNMSKKQAETNQIASNPTPQQLESIEKEVKALKSTIETNQSIISQVPQIQEQLNKEVQKLESSIQSQQPLLAQIVPIQEQMQTIIADVSKLEISAQSSQLDTQKQLEEHSRKIAAGMKETTQLDDRLKALNSQVTSLDTAADIKDLRAQSSQLADKLSKLEILDTTADIKNMQLQLSQHAKQIFRPASVDTATEIKETRGELLQPTQSDSREGERVTRLENYLVTVESSLNEQIAWGKHFEQKCSRWIYEAFKDRISPVLGEISKLQAIATAIETSIGQLRTDITDEVSTCHQNIVEIRNQLAGMPDKAMFEGRLEHLRVTLTVLEDRYNNITTDELHGKMVHWFLQTHPGDTAGVLDRVISLQSDVRSLQQSNLGGLENRIAAIGAKANEAEKKLIEAQNAFDAACTDLSNRVGKLEVAATPRQGAETNGAQTAALDRESAIIGPLIFSVGQVQAALHDLYQTLPTRNGARRALEFAHDFSPRSPPESSSVNNGQRK